MMSVRWVKADIAVASVDLIYVRSSHGWGWSNLWRLSAKDRWSCFIRKKLELNGKSPLRYGWQKRISRSDRIGVTTSELPIDHLTLRTPPPRRSGPDAWSLSNLRTPANGWLLRNQRA